MKKILVDLKIILMMGCVSLAYSFLLNGKYDLIDTLNILLVITISICISSILVTYNFEKKYINSLYRYLSVAFFGIGLVSFSYIYLIKDGFSNPGFWMEATRLNMTFSIFESILLIYSFLSYKKPLNLNKALTSIILISLAVVYIGINSSVNKYVRLTASQDSIIRTFFRVTGVLLKIYIFRLIQKNKENVTKNMYLNFNIYIIFRLLMHMVGFIDTRYITTFLVILCCLFRFLGDYCILRIMVIEIVRNPQEALYKNLIETIDKLEKANYDKKILYTNYERKKREEEIKNEILTNISHEFKTPVNVIYAAVQTQIMKSSKGKMDDIEKYNNIIRQNCNRLIRLINNFIDTTRFQKGTIKAKFKCMNVVEITESITMSVIELAKRKGLDIIFDTSDEELFSLIDQELYDRLILNLLSNSIKYSRNNGKINVTVFNLDREIGIEVKDDGIGMSEEELNVVFNRFERADKSFSRNAEGSGLGLNIVKKIVEIHQGEISITSEKDKGTKVLIKIPQYEKLKRFEKDDTKSKVINNYIEHEVEVEMSDIYL